MRNENIAGSGSVPKVKVFIEENEPLEMREKLNAMLECYIQHAQVDRLFLANIAGFTHALTDFLADIAQERSEQTESKQNVESKN